MSAAADIPMGVRDLPDGLPEDWPQAAFSRKIASAPHRWHVQIVGSGPDLVLLHGAGASTHSWRHLMPRLAADHRVIALDLPGHGFTRMGARGRSSLPAMAADILALLGALKATPKVLIGHSAGGALALEMSRQMAQPPAGIVVLNGALENFKGPAGFLFPIMAKALALNPFTGMFLASGGTSLTGVRRLIKSTGTDLPDADLAFYQRLIADRRHVDGTLAMMAQWSLNDLARALPEIDLPTLFLHGELDSAVAPSVAARAAEAMPDAHLTVLDGLGHLIQEEDPETVHTHIARFVDNLAPK